MPTNDPSFRFDDLSGRCVVLTGAAMGIGRGLSRGLAGQGVRLVLIDRDECGLKENADSLRADGASVESYACDLGDSSARVRVSRAIAEANPSVDAIIHNAAIDPRMPLESTSMDFFRRVMAVNVEPAIEMTRELLAKLKSSGRGRVILIGSITFDEGTALLSAYVAAKGAIVGLTRSLAHELGPSGITVNCISPGAIRVEKEEKIYTPELDHTLLAWQSVKRRLVPDDLLGLVCLLLSDAGGAISGQVIGVDGGFMHPISEGELQRPMIDSNQL